MKYVIAFLIIIIAVGAAVGLYQTGPKTKKAMHKRPVPIVQTADIHHGREKVTIEAFGTVIPAKRITLQSEVDGRIIDQNTELVPGGLINTDDMVIQVDPAARAGFQGVDLTVPDDEFTADRDIPTVANLLDQRGAGRIHFL